MHCCAGQGSQAAQSQAGWESDEEAKQSDSGFFDIPDLLAGFSSRSAAGSAVQRSEPSFAGSDGRTTAVQPAPAVDDLLGGALSPGTQVCCPELKCRWPQWTSQSAAGVLASL